MFKKSLKQQKKSAAADGGLALSSLSSISESISCSNEKSKLVKKCETQNQLWYTHFHHNNIYYFKNCTVYIVINQAKTKASCNVENYLIFKKYFIIDTIYNG